MHLAQLFFFSILFAFSLTGTVYAQENAPKIVEISQNAYNPGCELTDSCFIPTVLHVVKGDSVKWINHDTALHNIINGVPGIDSEKIFSSPLLETGETFEFTFELDNTTFLFL